jgi:ABC-2 type transport system ATP-binding protein
VAVLQVEDLVKSYDGRRAVDGLSFTARPGAVTGFLGPNGAGKSTSLRVLLGLDRPDRGRALIDGEPYARMRAPLHRVGSLLDARAVVARRGARPHLLALARSNGISAARVQQVLDLCGLSEVADEPAGQFSLGMGQRLGIAGALLGDPPVLVLDEPVNGLDPDGIIWIRELLRSLADQGRTVLLSSHLMSEMAMTATDLIIIGRGALIAQTTVADVLDSAPGSGVTVRTPDEARLRQVLTAAGLTVSRDEQQPLALLVQGASTDQVGRLAAAHGLVLLELSRREASLEEAYLQLTRDAAQYRGSGPMPPAAAGTQVPDQSGSGRTGAAA